MQLKYIAALLRPFGTSASTAELPQDKSTAVCWLLRADHDNQHLLPLEEGDWASLLETVETELRRG